ncbi:protease modulator HflC [Candidatus Persebacteraceae bacterium Df01]|jgi:membrane protease subunit HflC|uniref:Protein HflC n=1 Tax=Candidatus Doriopsillibacter californiensis TaxID=2970740 RepID=A0ABT7QJU4_9GAMM|nr:protease modulator HflC [Candidatus Persebacteraceae bacterium Df01]
MKQLHYLAVVAASLLLLVILLSASLFIVYPWQSAMILQFGEIVSVKKEPGLYAKAPWHSLLMFDSRVLTIDTDEPDRFITAEKENVLVDSYIKWRIVEPAKFYERLAGNESQAEGRLLDVVNRGLRDEIGKRTVKNVVTGEREEIMRIMRSRATEAATDFGVEVLDVRLKRVDLPTGVSEEVFKNMIEERRRIANERRAEGEAEKEKIRAEADRDRVILLSEAARKAEELRGRGDAEAAATYSAAFSQHPNFYDFYRSMAAYRRTLGTSGDFFLLSPESDFFRFLKEEDGNVEDSLQ